MQICRVDSMNFYRATYIFLNFNKTTVKTFQIMNEIKTRSDDLGSTMIV